MNREQATQIRSRLVKNGGPLAREAAECISWLLKQVPEKERGEIHPDHAFIVLLFQRRLNKPYRDANEVRAFRSIQALITEEDKQRLKRFYRQPQPKDYDKLLSQRKGSPITLMRSYVKQVEFAEEWCRLHPEQRKNNHPPEPAGWQQRAPGNLGERSWHFVCQQYPDIARQLSDG